MYVDAKLHGNQNRILCHPALQKLWDAAALPLCTYILVYLSSGVDQNHNKKQGWRTQNLVSSRSAWIWFTTSFSTALAIKSTFNTSLYLTEPEESNGKLSHKQDVPPNSFMTDDIEGDANEYHLQWITPKKEWSWSTSGGINKLKSLVHIFKGYRCKLNKPIP